MKLVVFGLSVTSTWGNGHGTTYRALLQALHARGHDIVFFEKNVEWYASNRDLPKPEFCEVRLYDDWSEVLPHARRQLREADVAVVGSYFPDSLAAIDEMLDANPPVKAFYDIDTPITVAALREKNAAEYIAARHIPALDIYFSFTGGPMLRVLEKDFGAQRAVPLYCSFDPRRHRRTKVNRKFACELSYMGTYSADRQPKLEQFLLQPAGQLHDKKFIVAGSQYPKSVRWPKNVRHIPHLSPQWHPEMYSSSSFTLNLTRRDMTMAGYSPSVRLFEAAACGAAILSDNWPGLDSFFTPGREILLLTSTEDVVNHLTVLTKEEAREMGQRAQARVLREHTSAIRAAQFERAVNEALSPSRLATPERIHAASESLPLAADSQPIPALLRQN
jgi:spore maturation protein CgeB